MEPGDRFCPDCGVEQDGVAATVEEKEPVAVARPGRARSGRQQANRAKASKELSKALGFLKTLRVFFRLGVFFALVGILGGLLILGDNSLPLGMSLLVLSIQIATACVMLVGAKLIFFQPFLWSLIYASLVTLNGALRAIGTDFHLGWTLGSLIWALVFWAFVPRAARAQRLMEENPDLAAVRQMTGVLRRGDATEEDYAAANHVAGQRARKKAFAWAGGLATSAVAIAFLVINQSYRPPFDGTWRSFQTDWEGGHLEDVVAYFPKDQQEEERKRLEAVVASRGWDSAWPQPEDPEMLYEPVRSRQEERQVVEASFAGEDVSLTWIAEGKDWLLVDLDLPAPPFDDTEKAWIEAWEADDVAAIGNLFENPARASGNLRRLMERRDWEQLPAIRDGSLNGGGAYREIRLDTSVGVFMIRFKLIDDRWLATSIKPPRS